MSIRKGFVLFDTAQHGDGLAAAMKRNRQDVVMDVRESGLKGRGGAGFPTGTKWMLCAAAIAEHKYIVCNADEGEPGTFKDRVLLDEYPNLVFDGMVIGGYAIGAQKGFLYLRGEYRYLLAKLEAVLADMRKKNRLGEKILGTSFNFDIEIRLGSGAYVCGEETALIESLEGHRGEARNRPPFPVNTGYMGYPTAVNNVETFAAVAMILAQTPDWFKTFGTEKSTGSKLLSVSGDCDNPGVYEVPFGTTVQELLDIVGAKNTKAVQIGGASGYCAPKNEFGRAIAFEDIPTGGSVIVFNESRDMLHVLKNFMEFFVEESCGQCTPCRIGNTKLLEGVEMIERGECSISYLNELLDLGRSMQVASKCGLGQSSPNPFVSIMTHFQHEIFTQR
jgi:[NiFe] hydrogenase diaphorase moiety large subunit